MYQLANDHKVLSSQGLIIDATVYTTTEKKNKGKNNKGKAGDKGTATSRPTASDATTNSPAKAKTPSRPCKHCGGAHWNSDCPTLKAQAAADPKTLAPAPGEQASSVHYSRATIKANGIVLTSRAVHDSFVQLDNQANVSIFRDEHLLDNVRTGPVTMSVAGINDDTPSLTTETVGDFKDLGTVFYHPQAAGNILSFSDMSKTNATAYDQSSNTFVLSTPTGSTYTFVQRNGLYVCDITDAEYDVHVTVADKERMYTQREVEGAKQARALVRMLGYPAPRTVIDMINSGTLLNCPVVPKDIERAYSIYGPDVGELRGKTTTRPSIPYKEKTLERVVQQDVMFVNKNAFLTSVSTPLALTTCSDLGRAVGGLRADSSLHFTRI
jgi:hypothetical protein